MNLGQDHYIFPYVWLDEVILLTIFFYFFYILSNTSYKTINANENK